MNQTQSIPRDILEAPFPPEAIKTRPGAYGGSLVSPRVSPFPAFSRKRDGTWVAGSLRLEIVRKEHGVSRDRGDGGLEEVPAGFDADELGSFDQTIEQRGNLGPALGA